MGFDRHFYEDHCYLDDATSYVAMNVEIIEDNYEIVQHHATEKPTTGYSGSSISKQIDMSYEAMIKCEASKTDTNLYTEFCTEHSDLFLLEDEKLVKPGDKFESHEAFVQYLNENAKRWYFYYKCSDSRKPNTENESYTYNCVYLRNKEKYKKKGLRKRNNNMKTNCPCKIKLRHLPNEKELTVVYVCNHHDHELSLEQFCKLQHGRRLPPYVKEEIMDFLALQVDRGKIRKYVEMETGLSMGRPFFYALEKNMQRTENCVREITEERLKMLNDKIAAVDEMYGCNDDENSQQIENYVEEMETPHRTKGTFKNGKHSKKYSHLKRKLNTSEEVTSTSFTSGIKIEPCPEVIYSEETLQSVKNLQDLVKCEIQKNPWVSDQCVPVLPNRTALVENLQEIHSESQEETENVSYKIVYYNPSDSTQEIINDEIEKIISDDQNHETSNQNDIDNIAYETVVVDGNEEVVIRGDEEEFHNETGDYAINDINTNDEVAMGNDELQESDLSHYELDGNQAELDGSQIDHVEYMTEDNEHFVEYVNEINEDNSGHDVGVQTNENIDSGHTLLPVFDVYMKDGNVMGFVVNNNLINGLKDGVDKGIQTSEDIIYCDTQEVENEDSEITQDSSDQTGDTYTKHEYVHKYNIDQYMTQPHFPKYVQILAKETYMDVLNMFTNVYNEKAMFKLTTTQKGKEGNTRIRYITHNGKIKKKRPDDVIRENLGRKLQSIFILKEKMRMLKKDNEELLKRNEYLQEVALKLVNME